MGGRIDSNASPVPNLIMLADDLDRLASAANAVQYRLREVPLADRLIVVFGTRLTRETHPVDGASRIRLVDRRLRIHSEIKNIDQVLQSGLMQRGTDRRRGKHRLT